MHASTMQDEMACGIFKVSKLPGLRLASIAVEVDATLAVEINEVATDMSGTLTSLVQRLKTELATAHAASSIGPIPPTHAVSTREAIGSAARAAKVCMFLVDLTT